MSAEEALIDTNVLVYALFAGCPEHAASLALLESAQGPCGCRDALACAAWTLSGDWSRVL
jgi:predicted nucleic acid-binding protein